MERAIPERAGCVQNRSTFVCAALHALLPIRMARREKSHSLREVTARFNGWPGLELAKLRGRQRVPPPSRHKGRCGAGWMLPPPRFLHSGDCECRDPYKQHTHTHRSGTHFYQPGNRIRIDRLADRQTLAHHHCRPQTTLRRADFSS